MSLAAAPHGAPAREEGRARVLLVDDHPANLLALEAVLEPLGLELVKASSGQQALQALLEEEFALVLLDVQMPGLDGLETARLMKQRDASRATPIIFLTAIHRDADHVFAGYAEGAVDYLLKPLDPEILRSKVQVFVELWRREAGLPPREAADALRAAVPDALPFPAFAVRTDGSLAWANRAWTERTRVAPGGRGFLDAFVAESRAELGAAWAALLAGGSPLRGVFPLVVGGRSRPHRVEAVPVEIGGRRAGFLLTAIELA